VVLEIHRHLVLFKRLPDSTTCRFRQILVVERDKFEVRVFDGETFQKVPSVGDDVSGMEIQIHPSLESAVLDAEKQFKQSVRNGWRAVDPTVSHLTATANSAAQVKPRVA
jgi:hypothetical protein